MDREKLKDTFDNVKPTHEQKERMLKNILGSLEEKNELKDSNERIIELKARKKRKNLNKGLAIVACFGLVVIMGKSIYQNVGRDNIVDEPPILDPPIHEPEPSQDDMGIRNFLNYEGHRYEFIQGGKTFDIENRVEGKLGILKYSIDYKSEDNSVEDLQRDNSTTFGVGGEILKIKGTDPFFRIGVKVAGDYYICQNVGTVDDSPMDVQEFFEKSKLSEITEEIVIIKGIMNVKTIDGSEIEKLVEDISKASSVQLSNEDYENIGRVYGDREDIRITLKLKDGTEYSMTYLKALGLITIGDSYYSIPELEV